METGEWQRPGNAQPGKTSVIRNLLCPLNRTGLDPRRQSVTHCPATARRGSRMGAACFEPDAAAIFIRMKVLKNNEQRQNQPETELKINWSG